MNEDGPGGEDRAQNEIEQAWSAEAEARLDAFLSGKEFARDGREVLSEIRNSLR